MGNEFVSYFSDGHKEVFSLPDEAGDCKNCDYNDSKGKMVTRNVFCHCQHSDAGAGQTDTPDKWCPLRQYFALKTARKFLERYYTDQANSFQAQILDKALKKAGY